VSNLSMTQTGILNALRTSNAGPSLINVQQGLMKTEKAKVEKRLLSEKWMLFL